MNNQPKSNHRITIRAFLLGALAAGFFAWFTVIRENRPPRVMMTPTQIAVLPYMLLVLAVLCVNPLLRLARVVRVFSATELLLVFVMGAVSNGVASYGLTAHLVPIVGGLSNRHWNRDWRRWNVHVEPFLNEHFFVAVDGTSVKSMELREAELTYYETQRVFRSARNLIDRRNELVEIRKQLAELDNIENAAERIAKRKPIARQHRLAKRLIAQAEKIWSDYEDEHDPEVAAATYKDKIKTLRDRRNELRKEVREFREAAFKTIDDFRRGLPEELRAIPGFVYVPGEGFASYAARIKRMSKGRSAFKKLRHARGQLREAIKSGGRLPADFEWYIQKAEQKLDLVSDIPVLTQRKQDIETRLTQLRKDRVKGQKLLKKLRMARRYAKVAEFALLDERIEIAEENVQEVREEIDDLTEELETKVDPQLRVCERVGTTRDGLTAIREQAKTATVADYPAMLEALRAEIGRFRSFDASLRRFVIGDIDWKAWLRPLLNWAVLIGLTYLVLMTFNVLIFRQWAYNEKLIYPLAELPITLAGGNTEGQTGVMPPILKDGLFWVGVAIAVCVLGWNHMAKEGVIPGVNPIRLRHSWTPYVSNSLLDGLRSMRFNIFFVLIGLTFLVPARISHSLWLFQIIYMIQLLTMVGLGYGVNMWSFRGNWSMVVNFRTAQGGGALIVFAAVILWKCRKYLFCAFSGRAIAELERDERIELRVSSWLFFLGSIGLLLGLVFGLRVNAFYAVLFYFIILVITIGLVRAVAEGGLLGFTCNFGPFHVVRSVFGLDKSWTSPQLMAPFWVYQAILFMDIKAFIAPAMANALKIRDSLRMRRLAFHGAVAVSLLVAAVVAVLTHLIMAHNTGADGMNGWFYGRMARSEVFDTIKTMITRNPVDTVGGRWWMLAGALLMAGLLFGRRKAFWLPHPIGLIMFVNPLMRAYWGSIFIGWLFKTLVSKYGNKDNYQRFRSLFIGLIVGQLLMCMCGWDNLDIYSR